MSFREKITNYFARIRTRHKLTFINDTTYKERWSFRVSSLNLISLLALYTIIIVIGLLLLIKYTPVRAIFIGGSVYENNFQIDQNVASIDSLYDATRANQLYIENLQRILNDDPIVDSTRVGVDTLQNYTPDFSKDPSDSILRSKVENELNANRDFNSNENYAFFFSPVQGIVSRSFEKKKAHFGVDIATMSGEPIKSCAEGIVVFTGWTPSEGNVIIIQHNDDLVSVYKHCSDLLKKMGEHIQTGDPIGIVGNTGENSSGPHLHFELWKKGAPIDPEAFISF